MKDFAHKTATSFADAAALLASEKNAAVIAGGTDLIYGMKGMHTPNLADVVIDLKKIANGAYIKEEGGFLKIGALTTLTEIAENDTVKKNYAVLAEAAKAVASPELRNMGTIGGNICQKPRCIYYRNDNNAFPCLRKGGKTCYALTGVCRYHSIFGALGGCVAVCPSDTAPALVALGASIVTTKKTWTAAEFFGLDSKKFNGENINMIADDEVVTEIQIPAGTYKSTYKKWALRKAIDFPQVSVACVKSGSAYNIALGGVYNTPKYFEGVSSADECLKDAKGIETNQVDNNSNVYKIDIAKAYIKRAMAAC